MRTVFKYKMLFVVNLALPVGAQFLHAGQQGEDIYLWFEVNTSYPLVTRAFKAYATGMEIENNTNKFLATVQMKGGPEDGLVFHIYDAGVVNNG